MMRTMRCLLAVSAIGLVVGLGGRAEAGLLVENFSASFGPTTTLGGVALGADTPFAYQATFDTSTGVSIGPFEFYAVTSFTIDIAGTTYTGIPNPSLNVMLADPSTLGAYIVGLADPSFVTGGPGFFAAYGVASDPSFSAAAPTPSTFSVFEGPAPQLPYSIPLVGVTGGLVISDYANVLPTASISAVPEPSSFALAGTAATVAGLSGLVLRGRRRRIA